MSKVDEQARKVAKTKEEYQAELDFRILFVADMLIGKNKKYKTYGDFFETLGLSLTAMPGIRRGDRHFSPYHIYRCRIIHNISEVWLLTGEGEIYGHASVIDKLHLMEERLHIVETKLGLDKQKSGK